MLFHSTRGNDNNKTFEEILMQGLADDGGLFMPDSWPQVDIDHLKGLNNFIPLLSLVISLIEDKPSTPLPLDNLIKKVSI